ncbi:MAG TPA: hypothetical protein VMG08_18890 [Allosphingosinicella sp.]|nr:hypothetical protein [Allosphingosinicella sp.]
MRAALLLLVALASPLAAQPAPGPAPAPAAAPAPVTVESYYRIRWGSFWEFMEIYNRHHAPILAELQRLGFIRAIRVETPITHMAGDQRWDLRVTIAYRDAVGAAGADPAYDEAVREISRRLFTDRAAHLAAETRRFAMLEEHWDVLVAPYAD